MTAAQQGEGKELQRMSDPWFPEPDEFLFRPLTAGEVEEFEQYARDNDPEDLSKWTIYHPVCRRVWEARGLCPATGRATS